jgi:hypothetical protein
MRAIAHDPLGLMHSALRLVPWSLLIYAWSNSAQEALQGALRTDRLDADRGRQFERMPYTSRWGDLKMLVTPSLELEYNSNAQLTEGASDDLVLRPMVNFNLFYPITERNVATFSLDAGYAKYLQNDELDQLVISPGSSLDFDLFVKDVQINLHNRLSVQLDPAVFGAVAGTGKYGGLNNTAGVLAQWALQDIVLSFGYDFVRFISMTSASDHQSRRTHCFLTRVGAQVHPSIMIGAEATASPTGYDERLLNDNVGYSAGGYVQWRVSENINFRPRAGYVLYTFSDNGLIGPIEDYDGFYFALEMDHLPSEWLRYSLSARRDISPGYAGNLSDLWSAELRADWTFVRNLPLTTGLLFESGKEVYGLFNEEYRRFGATMGAAYQLTEKMNVSLNYGFLTRDSDISGQDYEQHRVTLIVGYRL